MTKVTIYGLRTCTRVTSIEESAERTAACTSNVSLVELDLILHFSIRRCDKADWCRSRSWYELSRISMQDSFQEATVRFADSMGFMRSGSWGFASLHPRLYASVRSADCSCNWCAGI